MTNTQTQKIKSSMFGSVKKATATGGHKPDIELLKEVIDDGVVIPTFCTGCGHTQGFTEEGIKRIAKNFKIELPNSLKSKFIQTERCILCDSDFKQATIHDIED